MRVVHREIGGRLAGAWLVTALVDFCFASCLSVFAYHSTFAQLWQRVASTLLGPGALEGGTRTVAIGIVMHFGVAFAWSAVFVALYHASARLREVTRTPRGVLAVAAVYGPVIWMVMSFVVIPSLTGKPPVVAYRWWVQLLGHIPFVAVPIVGMTAFAPRLRASTPTPHPVA